MKILKLKNRLKNKYGSLSNFARREGFDRYILQKQLATPHKYKKELKEVAKFALKTRGKNLPTDIDPLRIIALREKINEVGGVLTFCTVHPEFISSSIFQILQGRRKRMSEKVEELFNHFQV